MTKKLIAIDLMEPYYIMTTPSLPILKNHQSCPRQGPPRHYFNRPSLPHGTGLLSAAQFKDPNHYF